MLWRPIWGSRVPIITVIGNSDLKKWSFLHRSSHFSPIVWPLLDCRDPTKRDSHLVFWKSIHRRLINEAIVENFQEKNCKSGVSEPDFTFFNFDWFLIKFLAKMGGINCRKSWRLKIKQFSCCRVLFGWYTDIGVYGSLAMFKLWPAHFLTKHVLDFEFLGQMLLVSCPND